MDRISRKNTAVGGGAEVAVTTLSPQMARLRKEYLSRCERLDEIFSALDGEIILPHSREVLEDMFDAARGALHDVRYRIYETKIETMADAIFVVRLHLVINSQINHLPASRDPAESALLNAMRYMNALLADDISISRDPEDCDAWLSQMPYAEDRQVWPAAAE